MRRVLGPIVAAGCLAAAALAASVGPAMACEPYTFDDDGFGLGRGIAWAFKGRVDRAVPGESGQGPIAVVVTVDRTIVGEAAGSELSIAQDAGCDGFHYGPGDEVIVAVPRYPGFLAEPGIDDRLVPPYANVTNYTAAVWVLDGERVVPGDGPHSWPTIGGVQPRSAADVMDALAGLPDTAMAVSSASASQGASVPQGRFDFLALPLVLGVASFVLVWLADACRGPISHVAGRRRTSR